MWCHEPEDLNRNIHCYILCFVDRASLYNLVNKGNLVHNLFLIDLSVSTCSRWMCAHHQEKQLCLRDAWYLLFCVDDCHPHRITSSKCHTNSCFSWWCAHIHLKHVEIDKSTKNKFCTKLSLFIRFTAMETSNQTLSWLHEYFTTIYTLVCMFTRKPLCHPQRIASTKCHINTVVSPDDGHIVTQNM